MQLSRYIYFLAVALTTMWLMPTMSAVAQTCGETTVATLWAGQNDEAGTVEVSNDDVNLYVTFSLSGGWAMTESHVHVASTLDGIPQTRAGNPKIGNFEYKSDHDPATTAYTYAIPLDGIEGFDSCGDSIVVAAHAALQLSQNGDVVQNETGWVDGEPFPGRSWATYLSYTVQCCDQDLIAEQNRTQTQGGWGIECNGNNCGCYRDDNFDSCLGRLVIGGSWNSATFTSSHAVETFLPQSGPPSSLDRHYTNPTTTSAGVLAGQVTALSLSVAFDDCDPSFGESDTDLGDLIIVDTGGACYGWTVDQVLAAGNCVLNGKDRCGIRASAINGCLSTINEAFVDGTDNTGNVGTAPPN